MVYGKDFAKIYDAVWTSWGKKLWPFLFKVAKKTHPEARTWLDLCCGTGSLLEYVCQRGFSGISVIKKNLNTEILMRDIIAATPAMFGKIELV